MPETGDVIVDKEDVEEIPGDTVSIRLPGHEWSETLLHPQALTAHAGKAVGNIVDTKPYKGIGALVMAHSGIYDTDATKAPSMAMKLQTCATTGGSYAFVCPIDERRQLAVVLQADGAAAGAGLRVLQWRETETAGWTPQDTLDVWTGD